ncbi:MAG: type II secretion system protein [Fimbriimonas sp.]
MQRRGFSLVELIVVIAIILVLAAFTFPVFMRAKAKSKLTRCESRLRQVGLAVQMYRGDNDGEAWLQYMDRTGGYTTAGRYRYPWNDWKGLEPYLKDGNIVWCLEPSRDDVTAWNHYSFRTWTAPGLHTENTIAVRRAFDPEPGRVVAFCHNHAVAELEKPMPTMSGHSDLNKGVYPVVLEDGSTKTVPSSAIELWYLWRDGQWHPTEELYSSQAWRFPGEPWPPSDRP